jgi:hypothetical protein
MTKGNPTFCKKLCAITGRRFKVFFREPRQWALVVAPFINICNIILMTHGFEKLMLAIGLVVKKVNKMQGSDATINDHKSMLYLNAEAENQMEAGLAHVFPFIVNFGFSCCSGIYMMTPLGERENKTRSILSLNGVGSLVYYLGLFLGDIILYVPAMGTLVSIIWIFKVTRYAANIGGLMIASAGFGPALITCTYFLSNMFKTNNEGVICLVILYLLASNLLPMCVTSYWSFSPVKHDLFYVIHTFCYFTNPFYTFFMTNYSFIKKLTEEPHVYMELWRGESLTPIWSLYSSLWQFFMYGGLTVWLDYR